MAYDANYWNSGQFMGNIPTEGPQVNQPQVNDTSFGLMNITGYGNPNWWGGDQQEQGLGDEALYPQQEDAYPPVDEEYQGPWSQEEYDERAIPRGMFGKPGGFGSGQGWFSRIGQGDGGFMGKFGTGEGWLASPETRADKRDARIEGRKARREQGGGFNFAGMGQGLMDLASQQGDSYEYNPFG